MSTYRILSLDGGAVRGIYTSVLLQNLVKAVPQLVEKADLIAGTSSGGILGMGLAAGKTPAELTDFWLQHVHSIFSRSWLGKIFNRWGLVRAKYDNRGLRAAVDAFFGEKRLGELSKRVLVPTFDLDNEGKKRPRQWKPKFFHNLDEQDPDLQQRVADVAVRTSAGPGYFPSFQGYVDGGVVANNPSMAALAQCLHEELGKQKVDNVALLSIGAGANYEHLPGDRHNWGFLRWSTRYVRLSIDGTMGVADYQCQRLLRDRYHRLAPELPEQIGFDDVSKTEDLMKWASEDEAARETKKAVDWLKLNW